MLTRRDLLRAAAVVPASLVARSSVTGAAYDLVIKGGRVIDPGQRLDRVADVAIRGGRVAAIRPGIAASEAADVLDAVGKLVTPGLLDIHMHYDNPLVTPAHILSTGVTTSIEGGAYGADNIDEILAIARKAPGRIRILVNLSRKGMAGNGELLDIEDANVEAARRVIAQHRDWVVGLKLRVSKDAVGERDLEALRRARQVTDPFALPMMVHVGDTFSPMPAILALLRPGDIVTHMYTVLPNGIFDGQGRVLPEVLAARRRGVLFDIGHGRLGRISWETATRGLEQRFPPDTITTDMSGPALTDQVFDLPTVLSKFLLLGMPPDQVIACATSRAARAIPALRPYGSLRTGVTADVAVLELKEGEFEFVDNLKEKRVGRRKLVPHAVVFGGTRVSPG